ncbi:MAG: MFS transporter [Acetobacteraceae bacterium]
MSEPSQPEAVRRLMWFFAIVYTVEGIGQAKVGVVWQPLTHFLKEAHGWSAVKISASLAVLDLPWVVKPLWGLVSDFLPLFGYRRRSYLLVANVAATGAFAWVALVSTPGTIVMALVMTSVAMAVSSTLCGALLVENGQRLNASAAFVNQQWLWFNVALMAASLTGGVLTEALPAADALRAAAWIAAVAPLGVLACLSLLAERQAGINRAEMRRRLNGFRATFRSGPLWLVAGFLFCYYFSPGFGTPLYFHMTDRLLFSQGFIGLLSSISAAGWIAGGLLFQWRLRGLDTPSLLRFSLLFGAASELAYVAMMDPATAVAIYFVNGVAAMIANIATLTLAAEHCPPLAEGFAFAGLMSVINLATPAADTLGAVLYEHVFDHSLPPLILLSAATTLLILPLMRALRVGDLRPAAPPSGA